MKIHDISQEVFTCQVYPGDPIPERFDDQRMAKGSLYNLTSFRMCTHNGTHVDAPFHFLADGVTVEALPLEKTVGWAYVAHHDGPVTGAVVDALLAKAGGISADCAKRMLFRGEALVTEEAAMALAHGGVDLVGVESQSVGPMDAPMAVHKILLSAGVVLLEGLRLGEVAEGMYFLSAAPLALGGSDGGPCRAILVEM